MSGNKFVNTNQDLQIFFWNDHEKNLHTGIYIKANIK